MQHHELWLKRNEVRFVLWVVLLLNVLMATYLHFSIPDVYLNTMWPYWYAASAFFVATFMFIGLQIRSLIHKIVYTVSGAMTIVGLVGRACDVFIAWETGELVGYHDSWRVAMNITLYLSMAAILFVFWKAIGRGPIDSGR